jgi:hypothetical protein
MIQTAASGRDDAFLRGRRMKPIVPFYACLLASAEGRYN